MAPPGNQAAKPRTQTSILTARECKLLARNGRSTTLDIRNFFGGHSVMVAVRPDKEGPVIPTREELFKKASNIPSTPVAVEAFWDGDTAGWFVVLTMIYSKRASFFGNRTFCEYDLAAMRGSDGDLRLFNGNAPPWPEAHFASEVGEELAKYYEVPFYFASPNQPEDACPRWWEQEKAYPCRVCGIPLLQREPCPWRGTCYQCHLALSENEKAEK